MEAIDPGLEEEWEYEYHETETESFYLNLDLTSHHGLIRPPRRRQEGSTPATETDLAADEGTEGSSGRDPFTPVASTESEPLSAERIQILGLHTCNPIVSYHNQIFSCAWADQIGTELVFAHPNSLPDTDHTLPAPLRQGLAFELLAANSVKILGRKANITSNSAPALVQGPDSTSDPSSVPAGAGDPSASQAPGFGSVPRRPGMTSHQAQFIHRLQKIKADKGETDTVRTAFSGRRNVNFADRLGAWAQTESQIAEIRMLNERAIQGDPEALSALHQMMQELREQPAEGHLPS
ncbi:hypothetical protein N7462_009837 [Penicillium macrosclerotiorum]|uniref:uncharacterized protein n=1 Tax=Penicillium macrosclerotiorum TaxID=303699 RepID=UPI0025473235|nr:uncharacterized protein N7462_009837 [Penicillium macrosclerotiorum]KAJ5668767.1 hypothetical protein N7462_009837 [Penicillium macrosclerotiorum]